MGQAAECVERYCRDGDPEAFSRLVAQYRPMVASDLPALRRGTGGRGRCGSGNLCEIGAAGGGDHGGRGRVADIGGGDNGT